MEKKLNSKTIIITVLLILNLICTLFLAVKILTPEKSNIPPIGVPFSAGEKTDRYTIYIGTTDMKANRQIIPTNEAREIINDICEKYVDGYTVLDAHGGWINEQNVYIRENTLVYIFIGAEYGQLIPLMEEACAVLNQNSVIVDYNGEFSVFYSDNH